MISEKTIVFINQNAGYLMIDIIREHQKKFKNVTLITGKVIPRNIPLDSAVKVEKIITYNRSSLWSRLFTWTWAFIQILFLIQTKYRRAELYIVSNPPFAALLPLFCKNRFHLLVFDVYPDALVEYQMLKEDSPVIRMWRKANKRIFQTAANIFTLSNGMKTLLTQYVSSEKIRVASVWTDNTFLKPVLKSENPFIARHQFEGKFLVIYSGNLGYTHELEVLIECALKIKDPKVVFVIIGEGEKKRILEEKVRLNQLENCILLPWQDVSVLPYSLAAADLGVVSLGREASLLSVPSKTYNLMSVGAPLLCIADQRSELAALVDCYQLGKCFNADEVNSIVAFIQSLVIDSAYHALLTKRSLQASKEFGVENVSNLICT